MIANRIAHWCPGFGNPWELTLGQWIRIMTRIPDIQDEARANLRAAILTANSGNDTMEAALREARRNQRKARRKHG